MSFPTRLQPRRGERFLLRHAASHALVKSTVAQTGNVQPFAQRALHPGDDDVANIGALDAPSLTLVVVLFRPSRPAAVLRSVISVIVDTVDREMRSGTAPHVIEKSRVGFAPSIADADASGSVVPERIVIRIVAARDHVAPASVFGGSGSVYSVSPMSGLAVFSRSVSENHPEFATQAPAAFGVAAGQRPSRNVRNVSARASALPHHLSARTNLGRRFYSQSFEHQSG
jgi:hypothetical protein